MCGILGIVDQRDRTVSLEDLAFGLAELAHRGPDDEGNYQGLNFALGHRRLAVFDLSAQGHQPMTYRSCVIVFNGAIYNFPELRSELRALGHNFTTQTDTEVILAAYLQWGHQCVERFNGQWAFAIYDPDKHQLFCSRDRFGIKPFYYARFGGRFHFASEIKAFTRLPGWKNSLNRVRAYEFLAYGLHDHTTETLYQGVSQLGQGCNLIYDLRTHEVQIVSYYRVRDQIQASSLSFPQAQETFFSLLQDAVRLRLRADVHRGAALSGGLDSSAIVSMISTLPDEHKLSTVSVCFPDNPSIDESVYIDAVQQKTGFNSLRINPSAATFQQFEELTIRHQDEPIAGPGIIAQFLLFRRAKAAGIKVMLDGQGADEILGGYEKFYAPYFRSLLREKPLAFFPALWNFISLHHWSFGRILDRLNALDSKTKGLSPAWIHPDFLPDPGLLYRPAAFHSIKELSVQLLTGMGLPALLHYEDRNAMAHGIESRVPFLDHRLVEFILSLPDEYKIRRGKRKTILREAMKFHLPPSIYHRYDKLGFSVPSWRPDPRQKSAIAGQLEKAEMPILRREVDWGKLPESTLQRIYYFAKFMENRK